MLDSFRSRIPLLNERLYLATHSVGPLPQAAFEQIDEYRRTLTLGIRALEAWVMRYEQMHGQIESLLDAPAGSVALTANATGAQAALAAALSPSDGRNVVLTTDLDFPSAKYLWNAQAQRGFVIREIRSEDGAAFPSSALVDAIDERVAVVAVSLVSYDSGAMLDVEAVCRAAHAAGALVVLDAYQAVGNVPIDLRSLGVDALVGGTHKWLHGGGPGLAFLYVRPDLAATLEPAFPGWMAHANFIAFAPDFTPAPATRRFEQGSLSVEATYAAQPGIELVMEMGIANIRERSLALTQRLIEGADAAGIPVRTPREPHRRGATICLKIDDPAPIVRELSGRGIDVDFRPGSGVRVSPHPCITSEECDGFIHTLAELVHAREG